LISAEVLAISWKRNFYQKLYNLNNPNLFPRNWGENDVNKSKVELSFTLNLPEIAN